METMKSQLRIEYNGVEATDIIANDCSGFSWTDNATGNADTLTLSLGNINKKWMNGFFPSKEDRLKAWIELKEWAADYRQGKIYCGTFTVDSISFNGPPETASLSAISIPVNNNFAVRQKNKTWSKTTLKTVMSDISSEADVALVFDADDIAIDSVNQTGKTDMAFAYSLCSDYGLSIKAYSNKLVVYDKVKYEKSEPRYTIDYSTVVGLGKYSIKRTSTKEYNSVKIQYTEGKKGTTLTYEYTVPGTDGKRQMFVTTKAESYSDAEKKAKAALRDNLREVTSITIQMMGSAKYLAADCFTLAGFGKLDGKYFIDSVTHSKSGGKYTVSILAHAVVDSF